MKLKGLVGMLVALASVLSLPAPPCALAAEAGPLKRVEFVSGGLVPTVANVPLWIGKPLGYFAEEGLDPNFFFARGGTEVAQAIATGQAVMGIPTVDPMLNAASRGIEVGVVGVYLYFQKNIYHMAVPKESSITQIEQLKGKRIGVISFGNPSELYARAALREAGVDPAEATFLPLGVQEQAGSALRAGQVDAISNVDFTFIAIESAGMPLRVLQPPPLLAKLFGQVLGVRRDSLRDDRKTVVGLARAVAKATVFTLANPEAAVRLHWKMFPESKPKNKPPAEALRDSLKILASRATIWSIDDAPVRKWGYMDPARWDPMVRFLGLEGKVKDPQRFFNDGLLDEINQFDEAKIREQARAYRLPD
jgi:NitT/TauT family transport system substrate-binding protein